MDSAPSSPTSVEPSLPCLTILCHPALGRVGERAVLKALLIRKAVELSRNDTAFTQPGGGAARPLGDPFLSRTPILLQPISGGSVRVVAPKPEMLRVDGIDDIDVAGRETRNDKISPVSFTVATAAGVPAVVMEFVARRRHRQSTDDLAKGLRCWVDIDRGEIIRML